MRARRRGRAEPLGCALCCGRGRGLSARRSPRPPPAPHADPPVLGPFSCPSCLLDLETHDGGTLTSPYSYLWWKGVCPEGRRGSVRTCPPGLHGQAWSSGPRTPCTTAVPSAEGAGGTCAEVRPGAPGHSSSELRPHFHSPVQHVSHSKLKAISGVTSTPGNKVARKKGQVTCWSLHSLVQSASTGWTQTH